MHLNRGLSTNIRAVTSLLVVVAEDPRVKQSSDPASTSFLLQYLVSSQVLKAALGEISTETVANNSETPEEENANPIQVEETVVPPVDLTIQKPKTRDTSFQIRLK